MQKDISLKGLSTYRLVTLDATESTLAGIDCSESAHTLVVFDSKENVSDILDFLNKILSAVKIDPANDTIILPLADTDAPSLHQLSDCFDLKHVLFFGIPPTRLGLKFRMQKNQPLRHGSMLYLLTDNLSTVQGNVQAKRELWQALQTLVN